MTEVTSRLKRLSDSFIPVAVMGVFMVLSMSLLSSATENSSQFGRMHLVLVIINVLGLIALVGLIGANLIKLIRQYRSKTIGSRLTVRLVVIFVILSVAPVSLVYYFSIGFLQRGIDSWFDVRMEQAMDDALDLSRASLNIRMRDLLHRTKAISEALMDVPNTVVLLSLNDLRNEHGPSELTLLTKNGRVIASSSIDTSVIIPNRPDESILMQVKEHGSFVGLAPIGDLGLHVRVALVVESIDADIETRLLYALYPVAGRINDLADSVEASYEQYKKLVFLREPLKDSFVLTLSLVLLVSLLTAVWAAFFSAQRLVSPIRILAVGTRAVAAGNYDKRLPATSNDELGELVRSFSDMTEKLALARDEAKHSQEQVERERAYLRALLGRLSSGVITLDDQLKLRVFNASAGQILQFDVDRAIGEHISVFKELAPNLSEFVDVLQSHLSSNKKDWRSQVTIKHRAGNKILMCQGAPLPSLKTIEAGYVVVFDDVTTLIKAQRDAAWGDVARRLAHEIKNPLTPIQLSAEQLRRKYLKKMNAEDAEVLDRSTHTIVQQVQAMQEMVKEFSEYARVPKLELQTLDLDALVNEVLDLYRNEETGIDIIVQFGTNVPPVEADPGRMRQLLHNLLKNAVESTKGISRPKIFLTTRRTLHRSQSMVELRVMDNGPGIPVDLLDKLFEPYTSTKSKGGGIGLAVVKRIVEEHSGVVFAENNAEGGATIVVRIPAAEDSNQQSTAALLTIT